MAHDILRRLVANSMAALDDGVYDADAHDGAAGSLSRSGYSLAERIRTAPHAAVISEIKFSSPSEGKLRTVSDPTTIAAAMVRGGAVGLSVLTQPHLFGGSPEYFAKVRQAVDVPMLMKDIIVDRRQIDAAVRIGADYILLIQSVFGSGACAGQTADGLAEYAHRQGLEVLLEVHTVQEYEEAAASKAEIIGINNRNLDTLAISTDVTRDILQSTRQEAGGGGGGDGRVTISESGIASADDIRRVRGYGADGFLVGSSIMKSHNIEEAVRGMVRAY